MNKGKKERIYDELVALDLVLGTEQKKERLIMYVAQLETYDLSAIIACLRRFHSKSVYFPKLAEIIEDLADLKIPTDELATAIASEIIECISRFGPYQIKELKEYLGPKYGIIERFGRWGDLCMVQYDELPSMRAQLRELAKVYINRSKREILESGGVGLSLNTAPIVIGNNGEKLAEVQMKNGQIDYQYYLNKPLSKEEDEALEF